MNQPTWDEISDEQKLIVERLFGAVEIDPTVPNRMVRVTEEATTEMIPVEEFLSRAERLALAKGLREELAKSRQEAKDG